MNLLTEIPVSAINPLHFREVVKRSAVRAFVYYMIFTALYSLIACGAAFWWLSRKWDPALSAAKNTLPPFEIRLSEGHLSTTLPEPFVFSQPDFTFVVDTRGKDLDASAYNQAILISQTRAIVKKSRYETREYLWAALPDFSITDASILDWLASHKMPILWTLFVLIGLGVMPLAWLLLIPVIFFLALVLMIPAKLLQTTLRYGQTLSIAFYAVTLPTLVATLLFIVAKSHRGVFWGVYLVWAVVGVVTCRDLEHPSGAASRSGPAVPPPPPSSLV